MGKRKSSAKPPPKKKIPKLDTAFACPFCNYPKSVRAKLDMAQMKGIVECSKCKASFEARINKLSEPIDIYSEWIDACEKVNESDD